MFFGFDKGTEWKIKVIGKGEFNGKIVYSKKSIMYTVVFGNPGTEVPPNGVLKTDLTPGTYDAIAVADGVMEFGRINV